MKRLQGGKVVDYDPFSPEVAASATEELAELESLSRAQAQSRLRVKAPKVPEGPISEVLKWVGDDEERKALALEVELAKDAPRSTLVDKLS